MLDALDDDEVVNAAAMVFAGDGQTTVTAILDLKWLFELDKYKFVIKTPLFKR